MDFGGVWNGHSPEWKPYLLEAEFTREGANREKLTVKKIILFCSPFMSLINREKLCINREKLCVNREKSAPKNPPFFSPLVFHSLRLLDSQEKP